MSLMTHSNDPHPPAVAKAVSLRESGQLAASLSLLHVACDEHPEDPSSWHQLGIGYVRAGKLDYAFCCMKRAAEIAPDNVEIGSHLANLFVLRKDLEGAIEQGRKLVNLNPDSAELRLFLGNLYASRGRLDDALKLVNAAIQRTPDLAAAHLLLAHIRFSRGQLSLAQDAVSKALCLSPGDASALQLLGRIKSAMGLGNDQ